MPGAERTRDLALARGRKLKRNNAITALAFGAVPGILLSRLIHPSLLAWGIGILIGMLWANAFEYFYHRFLLHLPRSSFGREHLLHHASVGRADEPEHLPFGSSPLYLAVLFATNGLIAVGIGWMLHVTVSPGILTGFSFYLILVEEIHWRIHMGQWLPMGIEWAREYHMAHHDIASGRFNVFFPVFDYLFGNVRPEMEKTEAHIMAQAALAANPEPAHGLSSLEAALLWSWMAVITIGVRFFWNAGPKS